MKRNIVNLFIIVFVICLLFPPKAYAYLDPGTGSMIVQVIIACVAGIGCAFISIKDKIINFFKRK